MKEKIKFITEIEKSIYIKKFNLDDHINIIRAIIFDKYGYKCTNMPTSGGWSLKVLWEFPFKISIDYFQKKYYIICNDITICSIDYANIIEVFEKVLNSVRNLCFEISNLSNLHLRSHCKHVIGTGEDTIDDASNQDD